MHQTVKVGTVGSVGDLARVARRLANEGFQIRAVGGGEALTLRDDDRGVGVITLLVEPDGPADLERVRQALTGLELDNGRILSEVDIHPGFDLDMPNDVGALATAAEILGEDRGADDGPINIMSALLVDSHDGWGVVSFGFNSPETRDLAAARFAGTDFTVMGEHGGGRRSARVDRLLKDKVKHGDDDEQARDEDHPED